MKWPIIGLLVTGIVAAFFAALLIAILAIPNGGGEKGTQAPPAKVPLLVAKDDLPAMRLVTADMVTEKLVWPDGVPAGGLKDSVQVIGRVLLRPMAKGQIFTADSFAADGSGVNLAATLPEGMRAVSVSLSDYGGMQGLLYPGSMVDVVATFKTRFEADGTERAVSKTLLQAVPVLAVENQTVMSAPKEPEGKTGEGIAGASQTLSQNVTRNQRIRVTLMVSSRQAEDLQIATEHGTVSLALRNPLDTAQVSAETVVLDQGRLADLNAYLKDKLKALSTPSSQPKASEPVVSAPEETKSPAWEVEVIRGTESEIQSFPTTK